LLLSRSFVLPLTTIMSFFPINLNFIYWECTICLILASGLMKLETTMLVLIYWFILIVDPLRWLSPIIWILWSHLIQFVSIHIPIVFAVPSNLLCCLFSVCLGRYSFFGSPAL
jgi:hypothetical protein